MFSHSRPTGKAVGRIAGLLWLVAIMLFAPAPVFGYRALPGALEQPASLQDTCPGNLLANPDFELGARKTENLGTSLSSSVAYDWFPWFIAGDQRFNREPEFKLEDATQDPLRWRVHSGWFSQKFFTTWATHTAGIYQRAPVQPGSAVSFSIWFQTYTGEADGWDGKKHHSDPDAPGNYRTSIGIDPYGNTPAGPGAPPPDTVIWSEPVMIYDQWTQLSLQAVAQADHVTVYTRGQPEFPVKHNDSFWDAACLTVGGAAPGPAIPANADAVVDTAVLNFRAGPGTEYDVIGTLRQGDPLTVDAKLTDESWLNVTDDAGNAGWVFTDLIRLGIDLAEVPVAQEIPPTPTPLPTNTPTPSPTPSPTATSAPTDTPPATDTPAPTQMPEPTQTPVVIVVTATPETVAQAEEPTPAASEPQGPTATAPAAQPGASGLSCAPALIALSVGLLGLIVWPRRRTHHRDDFS